MPAKPKPKITVRKPPSASRADSATADRFVSGASKGAGVATVRKSVVTRVRDARTLRRMTVYLDVDLHKRLGRYCVDHDLDMSEAISQSLEKTLPSE